MRQPCLSRLVVALVAAVPFAVVADDGITDTQIKLGMVNVQSGPAAGLGQGMRAGAEVRRLAQKSAQAAHEIKQIIGASVEKIEAGSQFVQSAGQTMGEIVVQVRKVSELIAEIARASEEQSASVGQVNSAVTGLDSMTQRNAALAEQSTAAAMSLSQQASELVAAISVFTLGEHAGGAPALAA